MSYDPPIVADSRVAAQVAVVQADVATREVNVRATIAQAAANAVTQAVTQAVNTAQQRIQTAIGAVNTALAGKAPLVHTHAIADVITLQSALDSKADKVT